MDLPDPNGVRWIEPGDRVSSTPAKITREG